MASLVTGILALFPVAIGAGVTALVQISRRPQGGKGMAIAGLVLGSVWTVLLSLAVIGFLLESGGSGELGRVAHAGSDRVGACLLEPSSDGSVGTPTDCEKGHDAEIYLVKGLGEQQAWPGYDAVKKQAERACKVSFDDYVGESVDSSDFDYGFFFPDEAEWRDGEHRVICVVLPYIDDQLTGSVKDSA